MGPNSVNRRPEASCLVSVVVVAAKERLVASLGYLESQMRCRTRKAKQSSIEWVEGGMDVGSRGGMNMRQNN